MAMDNELSGQNYQKVLSFMQHKNEEDFQRARRELAFFQFDLDMALNPRPHLQQINEMNLVNKYINFLSLKKNESPSLVRVLFRKIKYLFEVIFGTFARIILPQSLIITLLYPKFYSTYHQHIRLPVQRKSLRSLLLNTKHTEDKSVMVTISRKEAMQNYIQFFLNPQILHEINQSFVLAGYTCGDRSVHILTGIQSQQPQIVICRMNIFEEVVIVNQFSYNQIPTITPRDLHESFLQGVKLKKKDKGVIKLYNRYRMRQQGVVDYESSSDEQEPEKAQIVHQEIQAQNRLYQAIEKQRNKQLKQQKQQKSELIQEEQLRKIRLLSIPQQPQQGKFIRFSFRCPNGTIIMRNFQTEEKVQLIYSWVQVDDRIQFQQKGRSFEIMYAYPLKSLAPFKDYLIGDIFQDSHEKVVIRQI